MNAERVLKGRIIQNTHKVCLLDNKILTLILFFSSFIIFDLIKKCNCECFIDNLVINMESVLNLKFYLAFGGKVISSLMYG